MDVIARVWRGEEGLARTYWGWSFLGGILWGVAINLLPPGNPLGIPVLLAFLVYIVIVSVGIWRAATKYQGPRVWAVLAKVAVAALPIMFVVGTLAAILIPASAILPVTPGGAPPPSSVQPKRYLSDEEVGFPANPQSTSSHP